jgi:hypothetical protein
VNWEALSALPARENVFGRYRQGLLQRDKWEQSVVVVQVIAGFPWSRQ